MSKYYERALELRASVNPHYNCAQSTILPFAEEAGFTEAQVMAFAANFSGGMKRAGTCGAVTGAMMTLGLFGIEDMQSVKEFYSRFKETHEGCLECADLISIGKEKGLEKKPHCDILVYESIAILEDMLRARGKIK